MVRVRLGVKTATLPVASIALAILAGVILWCQLAQEVNLTSAALAQCPVVPTKGRGFDIFCPQLDIDVSMSPQLLSSPETWIMNLEGRLGWLDTIVHNDDRPIKERSVNTYIEFLQQYVCGLSYDKEEKTVGPALTNAL